jgi:chaperonin GroEL (HSP60 family)
VKFSSFQGLHPRIVAEGFDLAKAKALEVLEGCAVRREIDRDTLINIARTSLRTKLHGELADSLTEVTNIHQPASSNLNYSDRRDRGLFRIVTIP